MLESRAYQVQLLSVVPPVSVRVDGKTVVQAGEGKVGWWYDGEHTTLNILTGKTSSKNGAKVDVVLPQLTESQRTTLNGLPGKIARMKRVMPLLNHQWPIEWTPPALVHQAQTGNRMGLNPEKGVEELTAFEAAQKDVFDALRAMTLPESVRTKVMNHLSGIQR